AAAAPEAARRQVRGGMERPALDLVLERRTDRDPVLVVRDQILVETSQAQAAEAVLGGQYVAGERIVGGKVTRFTRASTSPLSVPEAMFKLRDKGIQASANHVAMLGGRDKGGATPEPTEQPLPTGTTASDGARVVIVDTGLDAAATDRDDGWLDGVQAGDVEQDIDLLDVLDAQGELEVDGLLDLGAGHGTFVAGIVRQVAPNADIRMLRALDTDGVGSEEVIAQAICRAVSLFEETDGRGVLNLSLGTETVDGYEPVALRLALDQLPPDVLVVAAAGNARSGTLLWPAASKRVIAVGSHCGDEHLSPSSWSNYGSWIDFSARGEGVVSTFVAGTETAGTGAEDDPYDPDPDTFNLPNPCAMWTGSSFSTPQVTGRLAQMLADDPTLTRADAQQRLQDEGRFTADYGYLLSIL
ncbi:MAG TPA: S8/S53 family peptidase, partial [Euzebyales bacterium]|nr:S8/S53 family peptidase [Euzebyales bacterium]